jgi:hypothetical protein
MINVSGCVFKKTCTIQGMKTPRFLSLLAPGLALAALQIVACSGDDPVPTPSPQAGSGGSGGSQGGASGTNGGGSAGSKSGNGGTSGTAGQGGTAGASGTAGGGAGGVAGASGAGPCMDMVSLPPTMMLPAKLSETGLYEDIKTKKLSPFVRKFEPQFTLWTDNAEKHRFIYIPECSKIDTSNMDHWDFPIGTRVWKEFRREGKLLETRFIHRYGPKVGDWLFVAYQWNNSEDEGVVTETGAKDVKGTTHDIPSVDQCKQCHTPLEEHLLGFGAIQLSHANSETSIMSLSQEGILTVPSPNIVVPGDAVAQAGLGYLHGNCGGCHNDSGVNNLYMRLSVADKMVSDTNTYKTAVNREKNFDPCTLRIKPGDPANSLVHIRMNNRGNALQMPPLGTEVVDPAGLKAVGDWITSLPPDANGGPPMGCMAGMGGAGGMGASGAGGN